MAYTTLNEVFSDRTDAEHAARTYIHYKPNRNEKYKQVTNGEFRNLVMGFASGLRSLGIMRGDRIALISESRPEWLVTDFASLAIGAITVPMFPTLTAKQVEHILAHSGAKYAVVSNDLQLSKVLKSAPACPSLEGIIIMNELWNHDTGSLKAHRFGEVMKMSSDGFNFEEELSLAKPEDTITIIYTSGTTGEPKGVMLTHHNLISNIEGALGNLPLIGSEDVFLSFLPLSHGFERLASYLLFRSGAELAIAESVDTVADNMIEVRPTIMTGVPRFYEKIFSRLMRMREKMSPTRRKIFDWAMSVGNECALALEGKHPKKSVLLQRPIADALVLKKIRARTGGRIRFFVSGGAALPIEVGRAFAGFGMMVVEGYGMTETSPVIAVTPHDNIKWGYVGKPLGNIEVKIAEDGEILTRGPHVMKGYYRSPEMTAEIIDSDGWLHTGDIGELDKEGYLRITDRKKHLIVTEGGKNVAPGPIEQMIASSDLIDQIIVIGDNRMFCSALIVPNFEILAEKMGNALTGLSHQDIIMRDDVRELISKNVDALQKELASYERVRRFALLAEPFTIENGMMTPTLKVKRKEAETRYKELIDSLYKDLK
jgi:long-chain acyl-CoA synthetase